VIAQRTPGLPRRAALSKSERGKQGGRGKRKTDGATVSPSVYDRSKKTTVQVAKAARISERKHNGNNIEAHAAKVQQKETTIKMELYAAEVVQQNITRVTISDLLRNSLEETSSDKRSPPAERGKKGGRGRKKNLSETVSDKFSKPKQDTRRQVAEQYKVPEWMPHSSVYVHRA
jgi:hypothetical protein